MQLQFVRDANGNEFQKEPIILTGAEFGEELGQLITPFLTASLLGEDANAFEEILTNSVLGTFLENLFEFGGGYIHDQIISMGKQNNSVEPIVDHTFSDIVVDFGANVVDYSSQSLTNWIMAEVFGGAANQSYGEEVFTALANNGVNYLVNSGFHTVWTDVLGGNDQLATDLGLNEFNTDKFNEIFELESIGGLALSIGFKRVLPEIETIEGQIANGATSLAISNFLPKLHEIGQIGAFHPVTFFISYAVGKIFDKLFAEDPQAYTNVLFNDVTKRFEVGSSWDEGSGNVAQAQDLAQKYVDFMNGLLDQSGATEFNTEFADTLELVFGHYENSIVNGSGRSFATLEDAIKSRVIDSIELLHIQDGDLKVKETVDEVAELAAIASDINQSGSYSYWKKFLGFKITTKNVFIDINDNPEATTQELVDIVLASPFAEGDVRASIAAAASAVYTDIAVANIHDSDGFTNILSRVISRDYANGLANSDYFNYIQWGEAEGQIGWIERPVDELATIFYVRGIILELERQGYQFNTKSEMVTALTSSGLTVRTDSDLFAELQYNLQIASEYQDYLQNQEAYDAAIQAAGPNSGFAKGWAATFIEAERIGITDDYQANGGNGDNVFDASSGNDNIAGGLGHDVIRGFTGHDTLTGDAGDDILQGGGGNDMLDGGHGNDIIYGGSGDDIIYAGAFDFGQFELHRLATQQGGVWAGMDWLAGDFTGDGLSDFGKVWTSNQAMDADIHATQSDGISQIQRWADQQGGKWDGMFWMAGDYNGDGRDDIMKVWDNGGMANADVHLSDGTQFLTQTRWADNQGGWGPTVQWLSGDFNGDGNDDMMKVWNTDGGMNADVHLSDGTKFLEQVRWANQQGGINSEMDWLAGDFNGDGRDDIMKVWTENGVMNADVHISNGSGFTMQRWATAQGGKTDEMQWIAGDFNGDGKHDIMKSWVEDGLLHADVHLSTGSSFFLQRWADGQGGWAPNMDWLAGDFNGDGRDDAVKIWDAGGLMNADVHFSRENLNKLFGGLGNDQVTGGTGLDWISGNEGNDTLTGGAAEDVFLFLIGDGQDQITDFDSNQDRLSFAETGLAYQDLSIAQNGSNAEVAYGSGDKIILVGVDANDLTTDVFTF